MTEAEYNKLLSELNLRHAQDKKDLRQKYCDENAIFKKGQIITDGSFTIKIERIGGYVFHSSVPIINYSGPSLTKKLEPRKDGTWTSISQSQQPKRIDND